METKCATCGKVTYPDKKGKVWDNCYDCNQAERQAKLDAMPVRSMQEQMNDILDSFEYAFKKMGERAPGMTPELKAQCAMHINNQYWKNDRTPK